MEQEPSHVSRTNRRWRWKVTLSTLIVLIALFLLVGFNLIDIEKVMLGMLMMIYLQLVDLSLRKGGTS